MAVGLHLAQGSFQRNAITPRAVLQASNVASTRPASSIAAPVQLQRGTDAPAKLHSNYGRAPLQPRPKLQSSTDAPASSIAARAQLQSSTDGPRSTGASGEAPFQLRRGFNSCDTGAAADRCNATPCVAGESSIGAPSAALQLRARQRALQHSTGSRRRELQWSTERGTAASRAPASSIGAPSAALQLDSPPMSAATQHQEPPASAPLQHYR